MPATTDSTRGEESSPDPAPVPSQRDRTIFLISLCLLTVASLWPLWATRFLPMQDYPQHLFLAHVTATFQDPSLNWQEFYRVDLGFRPYMLWYLTVKLLAGVFETEVIGKIVFSLYILLITLLALDARRLARPGFLPWGALLLYPFAFNQMYFMGFANYILSLPLLFLALLDLDRLACRLSAGKLARQAIFCTLLFLNHPYSVLVYIVLAAIWALVDRSRSESLSMLLPPGALCLFFTLWFLTQHGPSSAPMALPWKVTWWPLDGSWTYYLLQFTGMRWTGGPRWLTVLLWGLALLPFLLFWHRSGRDDPAWRRLAALYLATVAGVTFLPFWMGYYAYFNLRMAPVSYFALALLFCRIPVPSRAGLALACVVLALLIGSIQTQKAVAREAETIVPVLAAARQNALILPLIFDAASKTIDSLFFYQMHSHEPDYYHLLVGGGATPSLFPNAMMPVQYRPGLHLPYPETVLDFSWKEHGAFYDYLLVRQAPGRLRRQLSGSCELVASSGPWCLFRNKNPRKPL